MLPLSPPGRSPWTFPTSPGGPAAHYAIVRVMGLEEKRLADIECAEPSTAGGPPEVDLAQPRTRSEVSVPFAVSHADVNCAHANSAPIRPHAGEVSTVRVPPDTGHRSCYTASRCHTAPRCVTHGPPGRFRHCLELPGQSDGQLANGYRSPVSSGSSPSADRTRRNVVQRWVQALASRQYHLNVVAPVSAVRHHLAGIQPDSAHPAGNDTGPSYAAARPRPPPGSVGHEPHLRSANRALQAARRTSPVRRWLDGR